MQFVYLAFETVFDTFPGGILYTFPLQHSMECFLMLGRTGVLKVVVVPTYCLVVESSRQNHGCALAQELSIFNQLGGKFLIMCQ